MAGSVLPFDIDRANILSHPAGDIPYWIQWPDGFSEKYTEGSGNSTTVSLFVRWDDAALFKYFAMSSNSGTVGGGGWNRITPMKCPWADNQYLSDLFGAEVGNFSTDKELDPFDPDYLGTIFQQDPVFDGWPSAGWIKYQAVFVSRNYPIKTDDELPSESTGVIPELSRMVRRSKKTIPKERRLPGATFETDDMSLTRIGETPFVAVYEEELTYNLLQVPLDLVPTDAINAALVTLNDEVFDGKAIGTVLFKGLVGEQEPYVGSHGELYIDIPMLMGYRKDGWNTMPVGFKTGGGANYVGVKQVGATTGTKQPYGKSSFKTLFKPRAS